MPLLPLQRKLQIHNAIVAMNHRLQVRSLLARPTFDLDDFLDQMKVCPCVLLQITSFDLVSMLSSQDGLELMGITPLKEQMPWVKNNAMYQVW